MTNQIKKEELILEYAFLYATAAGDMIAQNIGSMNTFLKELNYSNYDKCLKGPELEKHSGSSEEAKKKYEAFRREDIAMILETRFVFELLKDKNFICNIANEINAHKDCSFILKNNVINGQGKR